MLPWTNANIPINLQAELMNQIKSGSLGNDRDFGEIKISMKKIQKKQPSLNNSTQTPLVEGQQTNEKQTQKNQTKSVRKIVEEQISEILTYTPQNLTIQGGRVFDSNKNQNNKLNEQLSDSIQSYQDESLSEHQQEDQILQAIIQVEPDQQYEALKYIFKKRQIDLQRMQNIFVILNNKQLNLTIHQVKKLSTKYDYIELFNQVFNENTLQINQNSKEQNLQEDIQQEQEQQQQQQNRLEQKLRSEQKLIFEENEENEEQESENGYEYKQTQDQIDQSSFTIPTDYEDNLMDLSDFDELEEESGNQNNEYEYEYDNNNENDEIDLADQLLAEQINSYLQESNFEENIFYEEQINLDSYFDNNDDEIKVEEEETDFFNSEDVDDYSNTLLNQESNEIVYPNFQIEEYDSQNTYSKQLEEDKPTNDLSRNLSLVNNQFNESVTINQTVVKTENIFNQTNEVTILPQIVEDKIQENQIINQLKFNGTSFDDTLKEQNKMQIEDQMDNESQPNDDQIIKKQIPIDIQNDDNVQIIHQIDSKEFINQEAIKTFTTSQDSYFEHKEYENQQQNLLSFIQVESNNNQETTLQTSNQNLLVNQDTDFETFANQEQLQDINLNVNLFETTPFDPTLDIDNTIVDSSENYQELPIIDIEPEKYHSNQETHMNAIVEILNEVYDSKKEILNKTSQINLIQEQPQNSQEQKEIEQQYVQQQQEQQEQQNDQDNKGITSETQNQSQQEQPQQQVEFQDKSQDKEQEIKSHVIEINANLTTQPDIEPSYEDTDQKEDLELKDDEKSLNAKKRHSKRYPAKSIENEKIIEDVKYVPVEDPEEDIFIISSLASSKKNNIVDMNTIERERETEQFVEEQVDTVQLDYEENTAQNTQAADEPDYSLHQQNQAFVQTMSLKQFKCKDKSYGQHQQAKDFVCQCSDTVYLLDEETWYLAGIIKQYKKYEKIFEKIKKTIPLTYVSTNENKACWASQISQPVIMNDFIQSLGFQTNLQNSFIQIPKIVQMEYFQLQFEENEFKQFQLKISVDDQQILQQGITFTQIKTELASDSLVIQYFGNLKVNKQQLLFSLRNKYGKEMEDQIEINVSLPQDEPICLLFCEQILSGDIAQQLKAYLRFKKGEYKITVKVLRSENNFEISYNIYQ